MHFTHEDEMNTGWFLPFDLDNTFVLYYLVQLQLPVLIPAFVKEKLHHTASSIVYLRA